MHADTGVDFAEDARSLFREIAGQHALCGEFVENNNVEVLFNIPKQERLDFDVDLYLQNLDELWMSCSHATFCMFPYDNCSSEFHAAVNGLIEGRYRIVMYGLVGWPVFSRNVLQRPDGNDWAVVAAEGCPGSLMSSIPYLKRKKMIVRNERWSEAE